MINLPEKKSYYIYIDTKIIGAIEQLSRYFQEEIFTQDACIGILCKYYKEIEKPFSELFNKNGISFQFIRKQSDLKLESGKCVFYLFNAQSNCRLVANRELTHIFVTHGESHKPASVKPIIRIYDFVVASGKVGIDRYLKSGLFNDCDINSGKVITLGDTFIGNNKFTYDKNSKSIVYAPTWEGGIPEEDYCSINESNTTKIIKFCHHEGIKKIYIQAHPNLGHRMPSRKDDLFSMISRFEIENINVVLIGIQKKKSKLVFFRKRSNPILTSDNYVSVCHAFSDISAMEIQFLSKGIPCGVFSNKEKSRSLSIPKFLDEHYSNNFIDDRTSLIKKLEIIPPHIYDYLFSFPEGIDFSTPFKNRIHWLCKHAINQSELKKKTLSAKF